MAKQEYNKVLFESVGFDERKRPVIHIKVGDNTALVERMQGNFINGKFKMHRISHTHGSIEINFSLNVCKFDLVPERSTRAELDMQGIMKLVNKFTNLPIETIRAL